MKRLVKFFLIVLLGVALGYSWATYHATLKQEKYTNLLAYKEYQVSILQLEVIRLQARVEMYQTVIKLYLKGKIRQKTLASAGNETKRP